MSPFAILFKGVGTLLLIIFGVVASAVVLDITTYEAVRESMIRLVGLTLVFSVVTVGVILVQRIGK
jgi:hypothetical protein